MAGNIKKAIIRQIVRTLFAWAGVAAIVYGTSLVYWPAAWIIGGLSLIVLVIEDTRT